jgi:hypothetical protein
MQLSAVSDGSYFSLDGTVLVVSTVEVGSVDIPVAADLVVPLLVLMLKWCPLLVLMWLYLY